MTAPLVLTERDSRGVATLRLNRPEVHNGYNAAMLAAVRAAFSEFDADPDVRVVVLRGNGKHFSAGADVNWLKSASAEGPGDGPPDGVARVLEVLDALSKPTVALVHGACIGGGVGYITCCDVVVAQEDAFFSIPEVRLGFSPSAIVPKFVAAIGARAFRRYGLTGERFDVREAHRIGLVHEICPVGGLDAAAAPIIDGLLLGGPAAIGEIKRATARLDAAAVSDAVLWELEVGGTESRHSPEADEGRASFLEKRRPDWYPAAGD